MAFNAVLKDNGPSTPARYMRVSNRITMDDEPEHSLLEINDLKPPFTMDARCACKNPAFDPSMWFTGRGEWRKQKRARDICNRCPMQQPCAEYALGFKADLLLGMWGGLSQRERVLIRRERKAQQAEKEVA